MKILTNNDKITISQSVALITASIIWVGLSLPREVAELANSDGWILVTTGGIMAFIGSLALGTLIRRFPGDTLIEYSERVMGKTISILLGIVVTIYFTLATSIVTRSLAQVICVFMLRRTPGEFILISQMLITVYLIRHGIEPTARTAELLFPILIIPIFAMYLIAFPKVDFTELLPFLNTPLKTIAIGSLRTMTSFQGLEVLLILGPYIRSQKKIYWITFASVAVTTVFFLFVVIVVFAAIGVENTKHLIWPSMNIVRQIMAPGQVFERLDALALALWTIATFTAANSLYLAGSLAMAHITKTREFKFFIMILFPWVYFLSCSPPNILVANILSHIVSVGSAVIGILVPLVILILAVIFKKGGKQTV